MRVWANPSASRRILRRLRDARPPRQGLHLSGLVRCARETWHKTAFPELYAEGAVYADSDQFTLNTALGKGLHNMLEREGEETRVSPSGLLYTPDGVELDEDDVLVVEIKETRKGTKRTPLVGDLYDYVEQVAGYCVFEGERLGRPITRARLIVAHICGDWGGSPMPQLITWDLEFEEHELASWKRELLRRQALIERAKRLEDIPLGEHYAGGKSDSNWPCKHCALKGTVCPGGGGERLPWFPRIHDMGEKV